MKRARASTFTSSQQQQTFEMTISNLFASKNMCKMLNDDYLSDVQFILVDKNGVGKQIAAHKAVLSSTSPVFRSMFCGALKETGDVRITDVSAEGFSEFLQLFYKTRVNFTIENIAEVLRLIDKYDVTDCLAAVELFLRHTWTVENVCFLYELATSFQLSEEMTKELQAMIANESKAALGSSSFASIGEVTLAKILQFDELNCTEWDVFNAAVAWATRALVDKGLMATVDNIKGQLKSVMKYIRFPAMSASEFAQILDKYPKILEWNVFSDIFCHIIDNRRLTVAKDFCTKKRCQPTPPTLPPRMCVRRTRIFSPPASPQMEGIYFDFDSADEWGI